MSNCCLKHTKWISDLIPPRDGQITINHLSNLVDSFDPTKSGLWYPLIIQNPSSPSLQWISTKANPSNNLITELNKILIYEDTVLISDPQFNNWNIDSNIQTKVDIGMKFDSIEPYLLADKPSTFAMQTLLNSSTDNFNISETVRVPSNQPNAKGDIPRIDDECSIDSLSLNISGKSYGLQLTKEQLINLFTANKAGNNIRWSFDGDSKIFEYLSSRDSLILDYIISTSKTFPKREILLYENDPRANSNSPELQESVTFYGEYIIRIIIFGINTPPKILFDPTPSLTINLSEISGPIVDGSEMTIEDKNTSDTVTAVVSNVIIGGQTNGLLSSYADILGMLYFPKIIIDNTKNIQNIFWQFSSDGYDFDYLSYGESLVLKYSIIIYDDAGFSITNEKIINIIGKNKEPGIGPLDITDSAGGVYDPNSFPVLSPKGTLSFYDPNISDVVNISVVAVRTLKPTSLSVRASLLSLLTTTANGANPGKINWVFNPDNSILSNLVACGETTDIYYTIKAQDNFNAKSYSTITISVIGQSQELTVDTSLVQQSFPIYPNSSEKIYASGLLSTSTPIDVAITNYEYKYSSGLASGNPPIPNIWEMLSFVPDPNNINSYYWVFNSSPENFKYIHPSTENLHIKYKTKISDICGNQQTKDFEFIITGYDKIEQNYNSYDTTRFANYVFGWYRYFDIGRKQDNRFIPGVDFYFGDLDSFLFFGYPEFIIPQSGIVKTGDRVLYNTDNGRLILKNDSNYKIIDQNLTDKFPNGYERSGILAILHTAPQIDLVTHNLTDLDAFAYSKDQYGRTIPMLSGLSAKPSQDIFMNRFASTKQEIFYRLADKYGFDLIVPENINANITSKFMSQTGPNVYIQQKNKVERKVGSSIFPYVDTTVTINNLSYTKELCEISMDSSEMSSSPIIDYGPCACKKISGILDEGIGSRFLSVSNSGFGSNYINHELSINDKIELYSTQLLPPPLIAGTGYYVAECGFGEYILAVSEYQNGPAINFTGLGSGYHWFIAPDKIDYADESLILDKPSFGAYDKYTTASYFFNTISHRLNQEIVDQYYVLNNISGYYPNISSESSDINLKTHGHQGIRDYTRDDTRAYFDPVCQQIIHNTSTIETTPYPISIDYYSNPGARLKIGDIEIDYLRSYPTKSLCDSFVESSDKLNGRHTNISKLLYDHRNKYYILRHYTPSLSTFFLPTGSYYGNVDFSDYTRIGVHLEGHPAPQQSLLLTHNLTTLNPIAIPPDLFHTIHTPSGTGNAFNHINLMKLSYNGSAQFKLYPSYILPGRLFMDCLTSSGMFTITLDNAASVSSSTSLENTDQTIYIEYASVPSAIHIDVTVADPCDHWSINLGYEPYRYLKFPLISKVEVPINHGFFHPNEGWLDNINFPQFQNKTPMAPYCPKPWEIHQTALEEDHKLRPQHYFWYDAQKMYNEKYLAGLNLICNLENFNRHLIDLIDRSPYIGIKNQNSYIVTKDFYKFRYNPDESPIMKSIKMSYINMEYTLGYPCSDFTYSVLSSGSDQIVVNSQSGKERVFSYFDNQNINIESVNLASAEDLNRPNEMASISSAISSLLELNAQIGVNNPQLSSIISNEIQILSTKYSDLASKQDYISQIVSASGNEEYLVLTLNNRVPDNLANGYIHKVPSNKYQSVVLYRNNITNNDQSISVGKWGNLIAGKNTSEFNNSILRGKTKHQTALFFNQKNGKILSSGYYFPYAYGEYYNTSGDGQKQYTVLSADENKFYDFNDFGLISKTNTRIPGEIYAGSYKGSIEIKRCARNQLLFIKEHQNLARLQAIDAHNLRGGDIIKLLAVSGSDPGPISNIFFNTNYYVLNSGITRSACYLGNDINTPITTSGIQNLVICNAVDAPFNTANTMCLGGTSIKYNSADVQEINDKNSDSDIFYSLEPKNNNILKNYMIDLLAEYDLSSREPSFISAINVGFINNNQKYFPALAERMRYWPPRPSEWNGYLFDDHLFLKDKFIGDLPGEFFVYINDTVYSPELLYRANRHSYFNHNEDNIKYRKYTNPVNFDQAPISSPTGIMVPSSGAINIYVNNQHINITNLIKQNLNDQINLLNNELLLINTYLTDPANTSEQITSYQQTIISLTSGITSLSQAMSSLSFNPIEYKDTYLGYPTNDYSDLYKVPKTYILKDNDDEFKHKKMFLDMNMFANDQKFLPTTDNDGNSFPSGYVYFEGLVEPILNSAQDNLITPYDNNKVWIDIPNNAIWGIMTKYGKVFWSNEVYSVKQSLTITCDTNAYECDKQKPRSMCGAQIFLDSPSKLFEILDLDINLFEYSIINLPASCNDLDLCCNEYNTTESTNKRNDIGIYNSDTCEYSDETNFILPKIDTYSECMTIQNSGIERCKKMFHPYNQNAFISIDCFDTKCLDPSGFYSFGSLSGNLTNILPKEFMISGTGNITDESIIIFKPKNIISSQLSSLSNITFIDSEIKLSSVTGILDINGVDLQLFDNDHIPNFSGLSVIPEAPSRIDNYIFNTITSGVGFVSAESGGAYPSWIQNNCMNPYDLVYDFQFINDETSNNPFLSIKSGSGVHNNIIWQNEILYRDFVPHPNKLHGPLFDFDIFSCGSDNPFAMASIDFVAKMSDDPVTPRPTGSNVPLLCEQLANIKPICINPGPLYTLNIEDCNYTHTIKVSLVACDDHLCTEFIIDQTQRVTIEHTKSTYLDDYYRTMSSSCIAYTTGTGYPPLTYPKKEFANLTKVLNFPQGNLKGFIDQCYNPTCPDDWFYCPDMVPSSKRTYYTFPKEPPPTTKQLFADNGCEFTAKNVNGLGTKIGHFDATVGRSENSCRGIGNPPPFIGHAFHPQNAYTFDAIYDIYHKYDPDSLTSSNSCVRYGSNNLYPFAMYGEYKGNSVFISGWYSDKDTCYTNNFYTRYVNGGITYRDDVIAAFNSLNSQNNFYSPMSEVFPSLSGSGWIASTGNYEIKGFPQIPSEISWSWSDVFTNRIDGKPDSWFIDSRGYPSTKENDTANVSTTNEFISLNLTFYHNLIEITLPNKFPNNMRKDHTNNDLTSTSNKFFITRITPINSLFPTIKIVPENSNISIFASGSGWLSSAYRGGITLTDV